MASSRHRKIFTRVAVALAVVAVAVAGGSAVGAEHGSHGGPVNSHQIPNLGLVKNAIKAYYGDYVAADGTHQASPDSPYAKEVKGVEARAIAKLAHVRRHAAGKPAVVFDVDDTTLLTYNYEAANDFGYNPTVNAEYVLGEKFPAVFGMVVLVDLAKKAGWNIFFITGRPDSQHTATLENLAKVGYPAPTAVANATDGLFTKPSTFPSYINCGSDGIPACSTTEYKSGTRKYIESLGYDIRGNFGDQDSDLAGGYSDVSVKMPNPMYYLP